MKRISGNLKAGVILALLLHMLPVMAAAAEQPEAVQLTITADNSAVAQGSRVEVNVLADRDLTNRGMGMTLYYDDAVLHPVPAESTVPAPLVLHGPLEVYDPQTQQLRTALRISCYPGDEAVTFSGGVLASLPFAAVGTAPEGTSIEIPSVYQYEPTADVRAPQALTLTVAPIAVTGVTLDSTTLALETGKTHTLTAAVQPQQATDRAIVWTSSDDTVATVEDGLVTAKAAGTAIIRAAAAGDETKYADCTVTVSDPNNAGYRVKMPADKVTEVDGRVEISPTVTHKDALGYNAFAFTFSYDSEHLELLEAACIFPEGTTHSLSLEEDEEAPAQAQDEVTLEILRYGSEIKFVDGESKPVTLVFRARQSANSQVRLVEARVDHADNALLHNAAVAELQDDATEIMIRGYGVTYQPLNTFHGPSYVVTGGDLEFTAVSNNHQFCFAGTTMGGQAQKIWYEFRDEEGRTIPDSEINRENGYVHANPKIKDVLIHFGGADKPDERDLLVHHGSGGSFIVDGVTGPLEIKAEAEGRYYTVTRAGSALANAFTVPTQAQYGVDYVVTRDIPGNFNLVVSGLGDGVSFTTTDHTTYTLPGQSITADFTVTINGEAGGGGEGSDDPSDPSDPTDPTDPSVPDGQFRVTVEGTGITLVSEPTVEAKGLVQFKLDRENIYDYTWKLYVDGKSKTPLYSYDDDTGIYTIRASLVTGDVTIEVEKRTYREFDVTVSGSGKSDVDAEDEATYGTDFAFELEEQSGYTYKVEITIGGEDYGDYDLDGSIYTIPGEDILGKIIIKVTRTKTSTSTSSGTTNKTTSSSTTSKTTSSTKKTVTVTFAGSGAGDASGKASATQNQAYTFTIQAQSGYGYTATAAVAGKAVNCTYDAAKGQYTIAAKDVTGNLVITIEKTRAVETTQYITLDGRCIFLVAYYGEAAKGQIPQYEGKDMFWSDAYNGYVWLVSSNDTDEMIQQLAQQRIALVKGGPAVKVDYSGNADRSMAMDMSDARLVLEMYRTAWDLDTVQMQQFLSADVNGDKKVNLQDAAWIVASVLQQEKGVTASE